MINKFAATIHKIGINPFVFVPDVVLEHLFHTAGKHRGKIPVSMSIDGHVFKQTLVKYAGYWRLYVNGPMLKAAGKTVNDEAEFTLALDNEDRSIAAHPKLLTALAHAPQAKEVFENLAPSLQKEIIRYISFLKTEKSIDRNVIKAINFLLGKGNFIGREKPQ